MIPIIIILILIILCRASYSDFTVTGGGSLSSNPFRTFETPSMCTTLCIVMNEQLTRTIGGYRELFLKGGLPRHPRIHMSLLYFLMKPMAMTVYHQDIKRCVVRNYLKYIGGLKFRVGKNFYVFGPPRALHPYLILKCHLDKKEKKKVQEFRMGVFKDIQHIVGARKMTVRKDHDYPKYYMIYYDDKPTLAVPTYAYNLNEWIPHISILNISDIRSDNRSLYNLIDPTDFKDTESILQSYYNYYNMAPQKEIDIYDEDTIHVHFDCS